MINKIKLYRVNIAMRDGKYIKAGKLMGINTEFMLKLTTSEYIFRVLGAYLSLLRECNK